MVKHKGMVKARRIASVLDKAYGDALLKGSLYWNGSGWVTEPAKNLR